MKKSPITPIHRRQISSAAGDRILAMISDGYWDPGESLPPQRELAKSLGIGMSTLREALQSLRTMGVLEMRHGSGTYVSRKPFDAYGNIIDVSVGLANMNLEKFFEARGIIECGLAFLAAEHATIEQINELFVILNGEVEYIGEEGSTYYHDLDLDFHRLISEMANNQFLSQINGSIFKVLDSLFRILPLTKEGWHLHAAVAEEIKKRSPLGASEAMRTLIEASSARYLPYMKKAAVEKANKKIDAGEI
ncbi:MAG: FadR/GntR family transcriptional regulator [Pelolinea sp.]|nr:FadR/GntR family transcriptional regulator [Pelolinea sp.]